MDFNYPGKPQEPPIEPPPGRPVMPIPFRPRPEDPVVTQSFPTPPESPLSEAGQMVKTFIADKNGGPSKVKLILSVLAVLVLIITIGGIVFRVILPRFGQSQDTSITYWGLWEEDGVVTGIIADYQKSHPGVKISYQRQLPREYRERLQSALARGEGPDIFRFHNTWVPMLRNEFSPIPASVYDSAAFESTFYQVAREDLRVGGSYVGVPLEIDGLGLFVNEAIFKTAGKTIPRTWDELRKTAIELTVRDSLGQIQVAGVALGRTENVDHWSDILALMMLQNGADPAQPVGNLAEDALTYFTIFSRLDGDWDQTLPPSTMAFAGGKVAMYFGPSWEVFEIKKINPNLDFDVVPVPQLPETNIAWASYWAEGVSKKSKNQDAAWQFLKYLSTKEQLQKLYQAESQIRLFGEPYSRVDMAGLLEGQPYVGAFVQQAPIMKSWYLSSRTFDNGINDKIIKYYEDAVNAVNSGKSAQEALVPAGLGVSQVLSQYGLGPPVVR